MGARALVLMGIWIGGAAIGVGLLVVFWMVGFFVLALNLAHEQAAHGGDGELTGMSNVGWPDALSVLPRLKTAQPCEKAALSSGFFEVGGDRIEPPTSCL